METPKKAVEVRPASKMKISVKYEELSAKYASQAIINSSGEEVFLDFSSGAMADPASGGSVLSVHTRIAMTQAGARRLLQALQQAVNRGVPPVTRTATSVTAKGSPTPPAKQDK